MGLAERRVKQRIGRDPNNLAWSNDTNKFGFRMLEKMGWKPGKGLGKNEQGTVQHLKVQLKEDQLGIGADKRTSDNWIINASGFEDVLKRLNNLNTATTAENTTNDNEKKERKKKKKEGKHKRKSKKDTDDSESDKDASASSDANTKVSNTTTSRRLVHRTRFMRNKRVSGYNAQDVAAILGVRNSAANIDTASSAKSDMAVDSEQNSNDSTDVEQGKESDKAYGISQTEARVSSISAWDYFASKAKNSSIRIMETNSNLQRDDWDDARPVFGLGFSSSTTESVTTHQIDTSVSFTMSGSTGLGFNETTMTETTESIHVESVQKATTKRKRKSEEEDVDSSDSTDTENARRKSKSKKTKKEKKSKEKKEKKVKLKKEKKEKKEKKTKRKEKHSKE